MSPQQLDGERATHLDDIYSLGATIYELLTGKPPFYSGNVDRQIHERTAPSMTERRKDLDMSRRLFQWCGKKRPQHVWQKIQRAGRNRLRKLRGGCSSLQRPRGQSPWYLQSDPIRSSFQQEPLHSSSPTSRARPCFSTASAIATPRSSQNIKRSCEAPSQSTMATRWVRKETLFLSRSLAQRMQSQVLCQHKKN